MQEELRLKVLCDKCGEKIGEVYADSHGFRFRPLWSEASRTADTLSEGRFWCLKHGYTNHDEVLEAAFLAPAGKVDTHRAHMT